MSIKIRISADTKAAEGMLKRLRSGIEGAGGRGVIARTAFWTHVQLVKKTPMRWTGMVRRSWQVARTGNSYIITNVNKVMVFLEGGTKAHGATGGKRLFIPLTKKAAFGGGKLKYGSDYVLAKRVKGIKALHIVANQVPETRERLYHEMYLYIKSIT